MLDQQVLGTSHNLGSGDFATEGFSKVVVSNMEMDTDLFQQDICIYIYIHEISIQWRIFIFVCFRFLPKNGFQEKVVFSPCRSGLGKSSMFSYYFPVTQLLVVWVGGGTLVSPQDSPTHGSVDPNSWKRHNQKLRSEDVIVF